jgi:seryl-tRNA synthetase
VLDLHYLRDHSDEARTRLAIRNFKEPDLLDRVLELDRERRETQHNLDNYLAQINRESKLIGELFAKGQAEEGNLRRKDVTKLKADSQALSERLTKIEAEQKDLLIKLPNLPHPSVPLGVGADSNVEVRSGGPPNPTSNIQHSTLSKPHWEIGAELGILNMELGSKIAGAGFPVFIGAGAKLQRSLIRFFLDNAIAQGYTEHWVPLMVNETTAFGTGQLPDKEGQMYFMQADNFYLVPTAEVPLTNIYRDMILQADDLPVKLCGYTPCFRREAGSYGKDVRGLNRVHQFDKVEIVQIAEPGKSYDVLEEMVAYIETLMNKLQLPYRIMKLCGGDIGFASAMTYDFEVWSAGQGRWLEVSSVSNFESFQSNRMKIRFKGDDGKSHLVHTLNGSALALPRIVAALMENNQENGGIVIAEILRSYTGFDRIGGK